MSFGLRLTSASRLGILQPHRIAAFRASQVASQDDSKSSRNLSTTFFGSVGVGAHLKNLIFAAPSPAVVFGFSGLVPFAAVPAYMINTGEFEPNLAQIQMAYGAVILSFLGGGIIKILFSLTKKIAKMQQNKLKM